MLFAFVFPYFTISQMDLYKSSLVKKEHNNDKVEK